MSFFVKCPFISNFLHLWPDNFHWFWKVYSYYLFRYDGCLFLFLDILFLPYILWLLPSLYFLSYGSLCFIHYSYYSSSSLSILSFLFNLLISSRAFLILITILSEIFTRIFFFFPISVLVVQSLNLVQLFASPWSAPCQASLSITISLGLLRLCSLSHWCHLINSSSVALFSSCLQFSQHQGLFQWVSSLHQVAKVLELQHQFFQRILRVDFL